jgi:hypothetical protein
LTSILAAVAFAAFCVWLTVRVVNRRERWAKWMLAVVILLGAYGAAVFHEMQRPIPAFSFDLPK